MIARLRAALANRYAIERELGAGGMATVYLAEDLRHHRKVAVKVLKPELAAVLGAERFLSEIQTTARLQHPNILPLFDSGEADGFLFYVMPYVEGESLSDRLAREDQLPVDEAVRLAIEVAEALHSAHEHGVVHRDIKPANIMVSQGHPLVADFGIALALSEAGVQRMTESGVSLGTPQYMSPEQAVGERAVGPTSDVYSLGCVLYEMLVGEPPHSGHNAQAVLAHVVTSTPKSVLVQRRAVPASVDAVVAKALEKVPADRFTSANDFAAALRNRHFRHGTGIGEAVLGGRRVLALAGWMAAAVFAAALLIPSDAPESARPVRQLALAASERVGPSISLTIAPDGSALVTSSGSRRWVSELVLQRLDGLGAMSLMAAEYADARYPTISPDGESVAFMRAGVHTIPITGGTVRTIVTTGDCCVQWGGDGHLYYSDAGSIYRAPINGGPSELVLEPDPDAAEVFRYYRLLPGGDRAVLSVEAVPNRIEVMDVESGRRVTVAEGVRPQVSADGYLIFAREHGGLYAAPLDAHGLQLTASPVLMIDGVGTDRGDAMFTLSTSGDLAYWTTPEDAVIARELDWVNDAGVWTSIDTSWVVEFESVAMSPDGKRVALTVGWYQDTEIWVKELDSGAIRRLTNHQGMNRRPVWGPDGTSLAFISDREGRRGVYAMPVDRIGTPELLLEHPGRDVDEVEWSTDGDWLVYRTGTTPNARDIFARRLGADTSAMAVSARPDIDEREPALSPDGRWVAYLSNETGQDEVWVRPFPDVSRGSRQVSMDGGQEPVWSGDSRTLFFRNGSRMVAAEVGADDDFSTVRLRPLFADSAFWAFTAHQAYDVDPTTGRFLMLRQVSEELPRAELVLFQNFMAEVRARVGH